MKKTEKIIDASDIQKQVFPFCGGDLIPLKILLDTFKKTTNFPYQTKFSMEPFFDTYGKFVDTTLTADSFQSAVANKDEAGSLFKKIMPSIFYEKKQVSFSPPFSMEKIYNTPDFDKYFDENLWQLKIEEAFIKNKPKSKEVVPAGIMILNQFYGQDIQMPFNHTITMVHVPDGLERYYKMNMNGSFIKVEPKGTLPALGEKDIQQLLLNVDNPDYWLSVFPPDQFEFVGFHMIEKEDITDVEVVSRLKAR